MEKSFDVFQTDAVLLRPGEFTSAEGKKHNITPEIIAKAYNNLQGSVPIYYLHNGSRVRTGYASKFILNEDGSLATRGHTYDTDAQMKIITGAKDNSAEISFDYNNDEIVDAHITGIAVVPRGRIPGTTMTVYPVAFGDDNVSDTPPIVTTPPATTGNVVTQPASTPQGVTTTVPSGVTVNFQQPPSQVDTPPKVESQPPTVSELDQVRAELEVIRQQNASFKQQIDLDKSTRVSQLIEELKLSGVTNVDKIVDGFVVDQQLQILSRLKENHVIHAPAMKPGSGINPEMVRAEQEKVNKKWGVTPEMEQFVLGDKK